MSAATSQITAQPGVGDAILRALASDARPARAGALSAVQFLLPGLLTMVLFSTVYSVGGRSRISTAIGL